MCIRDSFYFTLAALTISAAGVLLISPQPSHPAKSQMHPGVWRIWAWAGAGTALLLYALEYAPGPFPPRLEVNHPLYALSWLGIGECLFLLARWKHQDRRLSAPRLLHAALALLAAAALPALVLWGPESSYLPRTTLKMCIRDRAGCKQRKWLLGEKYCPGIYKYMDYSAKLEIRLISDCDDSVLDGIQSALLFISGFCGPVD